MLLRLCIRHSLPIAPTCAEPTLLVLPFALTGFSPRATDEVTTPSFPLDSCKCSRPHQMSGDCSEKAYCLNDCRGKGRW